MKIVCLQPSYLFIHRRTQEALQSLDIEGQFLFLGISGDLSDIDGSFVLQFKDDAERSRGIVLYLNDVRFEAEKAIDLDPQIKYFIDGVEKCLQRNVVIVGCSADRAHNGERFILNEGRWPNPTAPEALEVTQLEAETTNDSIPDSEQKEVL